MSDFAIVLRSLRARLFSTIVTSLTVAIAVALLLTLQSIQVAGTSAFLRGSGNAHLLVSADAGPLVSVLNAIFYANPPQRALTKAKVDEVVSSFPWAWAIPMQQGDSYRGFPTLATTPRFLSDFQPVDGEPWQMAEGRAFQGDFELVLGATVAGETGGGVGFNFEQKLGKDGPFGAFGRFGLGDETTAAIEGAEVQIAGGLAMQAPFAAQGFFSAANSGYLACGLAWTRPAPDAANVHQDEYALELTYVLQVTPTATLQPDVQVVWDPVLSTEDTEVVFQLSLNLRW